MSSAWPEFAQRAPELHGWTIPLAAAYLGLRLADFPRRPHLVRARGSGTATWRPVPALRVSGRLGKANCACRKQAEVSEPLTFWVETCILLHPTVILERYFRRILG